MTTARTRDAGAELDGFLAKYAPEVEARARKALATLRARLPGAVELVYDNYNALAIAFAPSERMSDILFSIALYPRWVSLFFFDGTGLRDPGRRLRGGGKRIRHIVLERDGTLDEPEVRDLMAQVVARAAKPLDAGAANRIVIKSIAAKQRPRRPTPAAAARGAGTKRRSPPVGVARAAGKAAKQPKPRAATKKRG